MDNIDLLVVLDRSIHEHFPCSQQLRECTRLEKGLLLRPLSLGRHRSCITDIRSVYDIERV